MKNTVRILLLACGLYMAACSRAANLPWVPRTTEHFKCVFKDGSYVEYKKIKKWFPYAEVVPHAQTLADWKDLIYYIDQKGKKLEIYLPLQSGCIGVGKSEGRLFYRDGYQERAGDFVLMGVGGEFAPFKLFPNIKPPKDPGCTDDNRDPLLVAKGVYDAVFCDGNWMMREKEGGDVIAETPVWSRGDEPAYPVYGVVRYVFRAIYSRGSKDWSPVELTDSGMIYEIGKTRENQSWAPKYRCLADRPRGGCDKHSKE
jgi:hypothetical protein